MLFRPLIGPWAHQILQPSMDLSTFSEQIAAPTEAGVADATLACFRFAGPLKKKPDELAMEWAAKLNQNRPPMIARVDALKAYVNFHLDHKAYTQHVIHTLQSHPDFGAEWVRNRWKDQSVVVEFSSPNMAKPIGIHHIRSTVIGNALAKLFEFAGAKVQRLNYIGDYGTTFGQLCYAFTHWGSEEKLQSDGIRHLLEIYVRFNADMEKNPALQEDGKKWFARLEAKDAEAQRLWKLFRAVSEREFSKIYGRMGIGFTDMTGEAYYAERIEGTLAHIRKFVKIEESEGAQVVFLPGQKNPMLIRKSDGTTLYGTRDIGAAFDRIQKYKPSLMLYVVAVQQKLHFQQLFGLLRMTDFPPTTELQHISFGMLSFKDGTMSTRKGKVIFLEDVLDQATEKALAIINEKNPECPDKEATAEAIGVGAVVFNDLKSRRDRDIQFSWEEALNFEGDSGPYIQYTQARMNALFDHNGRPKGDKISTSEPFGTEAFRLAWTLSLFPWAVERAVHDREPCQVAQFLLNVCGAFNAFYHVTKIRDLTGAAKEAHLQLVLCCQNVLRQGLNLLGLKAPERI